MGGYYLQTYTASLWIQNRQVRKKAHRIQLQTKCSQCLRLKPFPASRQPDCPVQKNQQCSKWWTTHNVWCVMKKVGRGSEYLREGQKLSITSNNARLVAGSRKMPAIIRRMKRTQRTGQWYTQTDRERAKEPSRGEAKAVLRGGDGYVGTAPSSCSGLISGPSARHGTKQTGESWVRAAYRRDWLDHREGGGNSLLSLWKTSLPLCSVGQHRKTLGNHYSNESSITVVLHQSRTGRYQWSFLRSVLWGQLKRVWWSCFQAQRRYSDDIVFRPLPCG